MNLLGIYFLGILTLPAITFLYVAGWLAYSELQAHLRHRRHTR